MSRPDTAFKVRMDDPLKARIAAAAQANNRSMNAEILARLAASFDADQQMRGLRDALLSLDRRLEALMLNMGHTPAQVDAYIEGQAALRDIATRQERERK